MKRVFVGLTLILFTAVTVLTGIGQTTAAEFPAPGGVVTLFAHDPALATISLLDGRSGLVTKDHVVYNRDSHVAFEIYGKDALSVGIQGGQRGAILDLGSAQELQARYGYKETVGSPQGYASIHRAAGSLVILKEAKAGEFQPLIPDEALAAKATSGASAAVVVGHIYLIRIIDRRGEIVTAKVRVLAFTPAQSVTIEWERL